MMYRKTYLKIDLDNYKKNLEYIKNKSHKDIICVLKADGYGTNDYYLAKAALKAGIKFFAVSSIDEAVRLRKNGINEKILVLGYVGEEALEAVKKYDISIVTVSKDYILKNKEKLNGVKMHLKYNTGMNRIGILPSEGPEVLKTLIECGADVEGVMSHYARSDESHEYTVGQFELFKKCVEELNYDFKYIHISNTDGALSMDESFTNYVRVGIGALGYSAVDDDLKQCLGLYSEVSNVKQVPSGERVSYGGHYICDGKGYILTLPIGYADGLIRMNTGLKVYVDGEYGQIVGSICMDQVMIKVDDYHEVGTVVEIFGNKISLKDRAEELKTIPYEIMCLISDRVTRIFIEDGKELVINNRFDFIH